MGYPICDWFGSIRVIFFKLVLSCGKGKNKKLEASLIFVQIVTVWESWIWELWLGFLNWLLLRLQAKVLLYFRSGGLSFVYQSLKRLFFLLECNCFYNVGSVSAEKTTRMGRKYLP